MRTRNRNMYYHSSNSSPNSAETLDKTSSNRLASYWHKYCETVKTISWPFLLFFIFHSIIGIVLGLLIGYAAFKSPPTNPCTISTTTTMSTLSNFSITNSLPPTETTITTSSLPSTSPSTTTSSLPSTTPSTTTSTLSNTTPNTTTSTVFATSTSTTTFIPDACPPVLVKENRLHELLSLNETLNSTDFLRFTIDYTSPMGFTGAMIMFEFITKWGTWYLDDVSMKEIGGSTIELIDNGGFETGNLGSKWKFCDPRYPWMPDPNIVKHTKYTGLYSYESKDLDVGSEEYLAQTINIKTNTNYKIEFYSFCRGDAISAKVFIILN